MLKYIITSVDNGKLLKSILLDKMNISKRLLNRLKTQNKIFVDGQLRKTIDSVFEGETITVDINTDIEDNADILPENLKLDILYKDEYIIAINKRPNMVMHPVSGHQSGTVANGIAYLLQAENKPVKIHPVNRLDRDTSGIVLIAMNPFVQEHLIKQMKENNFKKEYIAIVDGIIEQPTGTINQPIGRVPGSIMNRQICADGANAVTHFSVLETYTSATKVKLSLETGRTHQIRVHLNHIGHPIIGDDLYFEKSDFINRQALHACSISFIHPITKERMDINSTLPEDILNLIKSF